MVMQADPAEKVRARLASALLSEKEAAKAESRRPFWTAASLGNLIGSKDYVRDFLAGNKESLSVDAAILIEATLHKPHGWLHGTTSLIPSFDPDAAADPHDSDANPSTAHFPTDAIKELAARAGMGGGELIASINRLKNQGDWHQDTYADDYWRLPPAFIRDTLSSRVADLLVITCKGDSMVPTLSGGDKVVVNTFEKTPTVDGLYAILNGAEEVVVKRLAIVGREPPRLKIISDNPSTPPEEYAWGDVPIVGRVVAGIKLF